MRAIRTEILRNRFTAVVEEAAIIAYRSAYTSFIKETQDFQCALATREGELFAYPRLSGTSSSVGILLSPVLDLIGRDAINPGDVILTNDPYTSGGLVTHVPDLHLIRPIFVDGELLCFAWGFLHSSDIGGAVPGSISPSFSEVFQEGLRLRPAKLYERDVLNEPVLDILRDNVRIPEQVWGDLRALNAALASLDARMAELCGSYGRQEIESGIEDLLAFSERKAREVIATIPDGAWSFCDYLEVMPGRPILLHCRMSVLGSEVTLDFSDSSPQVAAACNFVNGNARSAALSRAILTYILTHEPDAPLNGGLLRSVRSVAPQGSILNAQFPAAMGNRSVTFSRIYDVVLGCLNQAVPGGVCAAGGGQAAIIAASAFDQRSETTKVGVVQPLIGGSGGRDTLDGIDGTDVLRGYLRSAPVEMIESELPLTIRRYGLAADTFGPGRHRGGAAVEIELESQASAMTVTVRGCDRLSFAPWGVEGGRAGTTGAATLNGEPLGLITVLELARGDRLRLRSPSGGGFGDPLEREPQDVLRDVRRGLLTAEAALRDYGVVIRGGVVVPATQEARALRSGERRAGFDAGPVRAAYEAERPVPTQAALNRRVLTVPLGIRQSLRAEIDRRLRPGASAEDVDAVFPEALAAASH